MEKCSNPRIYVVDDYSNMFKFCGSFTLKKSLNVLTYSYIYMCVYYIILLPL